MQLIKSTKNKLIHFESLGTKVGAKVSLVKYFCKTHYFKPDTENIASLSYSLIFHADIIADINLVEYSSIQKQEHQFRIPSEY